MKIILHRSYGQIEIEAAADPDECPKCGAGLFLHYRETKDDYKYFELHCRGEVTHRTQFGQDKTSGLFYKREWEVWTHQTPTAADRDDFEREQARKDHEWNSPRPLAESDEFENDEQFQAAFKAIRDRLGVPWKKKPDEDRDQYLERLRRQFRQLQAVQEGVK